MRLIDADALELVPDVHNVMNGVRFCGRGGGKTVAMVQAALKQMIDNAPTIDATPSLHGQWIAIRDRWGDLIGQQCSACGRSVKKDGENFCPRCGLKMDAKDTNVPTKDGGADNG